MLRLIEKRTAGAGYTHLYIVSYHQFGRAVALYERYGYRYIDRALDRSGLYEGAPVHMVKELSGKD